MNLHELGVLMEVIQTVEAVARKNGVTTIDTVVLQIGELSSVIPRYIEACYPAAVDGTLLKDTKLKIEILPGNALCRKCGKVFNLLASQSCCPSCKIEDWELLSGKEFMIKEIVVY